MPRPSPDSSWPPTAWWRNCANSSRRHIPLLRTWRCGPILRIAAAATKRRFSPCFAKSRITPSQTPPARSNLGGPGRRPEGADGLKPTDIGAPDYFHKVVDCQWACPSHTPVPEYIRLIAAGRYDDAYMVNWNSNAFPGILGRTCDRPCEPACPRSPLYDVPAAGAKGAAAGAETGA